MNKTKMFQVGMMLIGIIGVAGCATTSSKVVPNADSTPGIVLGYSIEKVQQAAVNALAVIGCDIVKQDPTYVEGHRPNKVGFFVGSGGETVRVWLEALDPQKTNMKVKTAKSFVGMAGQKNWDKQAVKEITAELSK